MLENLVILVVLDVLDPYLFSFGFMVFIEPYHYIMVLDVIEP